MHGQKFNKATQAMIFSTQTRLGSSFILFLTKKILEQKLSKERIAVLEYVNLTEKEKKITTVIGKIGCPRCLKNVKTFPVNYLHSKKAWMTS